MVELKGNIIQLVKAIITVWNNHFLKVGLVVVILSLLSGCSSQMEAAKPTIDDGTNLVIPTVTQTLLPPTSTFTPELSFTPTVKPTEKPKGLAERWNDPEVLARVQAKFEENKPLFDQIIAGTLIYHDEKGKAYNVREYMQAYYYSDSTSFFQSFGYPTASAGAVGKKGLLLTHERLQYSPEYQVDVGYFVFFNNNSDDKPFEYVPLVLAVSDTKANQSSSIGFSDLSGGGGRFNSFGELNYYLVNQLRQGLPLYDINITSVVDLKTGARNSEPMVSRYLWGKLGFKKYSEIQFGDKYFGEKDSMDQFITNYFTDENYPAFSGMKSENTAAGWGGADQWAEEAAKIKVGLLVFGVHQIAR
jgi:hypothetical protein